MGTLAIRPNSGRAYALALALLLLALAVQWSVRLVVGAQFPFLFILPAVGIAAMWGGWRPALLVLAGGALDTWVWMDGQRGPALAQASGQVAFAGYLLAGGLLLATGGVISGLRARAAAAAEGLGEQVRDLEALHVLNARLALLPDLRQQLQALLETLCRLQDAERGWLAVRSPGEGSARVVASVGLTPAALLAEVEAPPREAAGPSTVCVRTLENRSGQAFGTAVFHFAQPRVPGKRERRLGDLCTGIVSVLVERDEALRTAHASSRRLQVALDTSAVPFGLMLPLRDAQGEVTGFRWEYVNAAAARQLRRAPAELAGLPVRETLSPALEMEPGARARMLDALRLHRTMRFETWTQAPRGRRWYDVIASPYDGGLAVWFSDVTRRRQQEEALREADRRKDEFLAILAHELRNPLAPVRQAAMIARSPKATEEKKRWAHEVIERQVGHMALLLDDLLDVSRITRGKLDLRREPVPLAEAVEAALEPARPLIEARRQHLETRLPDVPLCLDADRLRIAQVLSNLLTNAGKYTPEGGRITLQARREGDWAVIEVRDTGAGIAPEALDRIFEMFTQVRSPEAGRAGGLGIGLALSRGLVELHGGRLDAFSAGPGQGSTFTVRLPILAGPAVRSGDAGRTGARTMRPRRVLVADDNRDAAQSLADLLQMAGHEVKLAFDGEEALQAFERMRPDVALLDIGMPRRTGNEVAQAIRAHPEGRTTLLVAITGWGQERDREAARGAGFDRHFTKPVDPRRVLELLAEDLPRAAP